MGKRKEGMGREVGNGRGGREGEGRTPVRDWESAKVATLVGAWHIYTFTWRLCVRAMVQSGSEGVLVKSLRRLNGRLHQRLDIVVAKLASV